MSGNFEVLPCGTQARLAAVEAERDALRAALAERVVSQTMLTNLAMQDGRLYATIKGGAAGLLAAGFAELLHQHPEATNYLEMSFLVGGKPVIVTVQKGDRPTPHALRTKAEKQRDALRADAERYRWLASRASKDTAYDRYGNGALWSIGFFADDSRHGLGAAIDAAMKGGGNG